jgi:hypothetical protein
LPAFRLRPKDGALGGSVDHRTLVLRDSPFGCAIEFCIKQNVDRIMPSAE